MFNLLYKYRLTLAAVSGTIQTLPDAMLLPVQKPNSSEKRLMKMSEPMYTRITTIGGMLVVLLVNISGEEIVRTAILAGIGAAVSYVVSLILKAVVNWWKSFRG